jgi:ATP-dependent DNA helicase RecG
MSNPHKFDPRKMMEMAIEAMRQSIQEPRPDGKAGPFVGVVLFKPDGTVETACRGELRLGDHAEYTLLERKNRSSRLDGSILFVTLEPCAPGSRQEPKLSCAERIVNARIKEIWVGISDPDPTVDRKGIKYLQDNGVVVRMFDRDLQETIREASKEFIAQALDRAAAVREEEKPKAVSLSPLERALASAETTDFSGEAVKLYRAIAKLPEAVDSPAFNRRLLQQGLLQEVEGRAMPTGFGLLLFGREPRRTMLQAGLLGTIHYTDGAEELKDFDGPQVLVPEQVLQWLRDKLPDPIERTEARRRKANEVLSELVREGVVNALIHRDYAIEGAKCQLVVTPDTIAVKSPGKPVDPITIEQMQSFSAPMLSRNPVLHYVFAQMELAEERGLGLKSLKSRAEAAGLPLPRYAWEDPYLVLTLFRTAESAARELDNAILRELTPEEQKGWSFLAGRVTATQSEYAQHLGVTARTAQRHLTHFVELGLLRRHGQGPATKYEVIR